jgi:hypothetical protein
MGTRRLLWIKGMAEGMLSKIIGTWPATVSFKAEFAVYKKVVDEQKLKLDQ